MGKVWIVADTTYRETARQPLYYILLGFFAAAIYFSRFFTLFAFQEGDEANMIREMGIASITICGVLLGVVMSSVVITSEVEKLTTLTVLSKPIGRGQFLCGKYLGILLANALGLVVLFCVLTYTLWVKEGMHKIEDSGSLFVAPGSATIVLSFPIPFDGSLDFTYGVYLHLAAFFGGVLAPVVNAVALSFFQVAILGALAVAIAPHFSLVVNGSAAFVLFAMGHLTQYIHLKAEDASWLFYIPAQILYVVLPNLSYFNAASLLATKSEISLQYVGAAGAYGILYIAVTLLVANLLFSRKEVK